MNKCMQVTQSVAKNILDGSQTQHRWPLKPQPEVIPCEDEGSYVKWKGMQHDCIYDLTHFLKFQVGDEVWFREAFITGYDVIDGQLQDCDEDGNCLEKKVWYMADADPQFVWYDDDGFIMDNVPWKPSIHMPKWAVRPEMKKPIIRSWIEQLKDISEADAKAEGVSGTQKIQEHYRQEFWRLFDSIYPGFYDKNIWVQCIEFRKEA